MPPYRGVVPTNRMVMLSVTPGGILRIHRGYAHAPDQVLKAIVRFLKRGTRRAARRRPSGSSGVSGRSMLRRQGQRAGSSGRGRACGPPAPARGDPPAAERAALQRLRGIRFRLSGRMRTRLGELAMDVTTLEATESRSTGSISRTEWDEVERTILRDGAPMAGGTGPARQSRGGVRAKAREVGAGRPRAGGSPPPTPYRERHSTPFVRG
jgi:hypothetical protein